jgi:Streptomyces sporulation and cell division protein, SsgA
MSNTNDTIVTADVTVGRYIGNGALVKFSTRLNYDPADPYAVEATFYTQAGPITWVFGRELLDVGTSQPAGEGDILLWPSLDPDRRAVVILEFGGPDGTALMQVRTQDIHGFLRRTFSEVPRGQESGRVDTNALIEALLAEPC